jgi:hypothetical protein
MFRPNRQKRSFTAGLLSLIVMLPILLLSACNQSTPVPPTPTPFVILSPTPVPVSGNLIDQSQRTLLQIANSVPTHIGRFTLDVNHSTGAQQGLALIYNASTGGVLTIAVWVMPTANLAQDRYSTETGIITAPKFPIALGDEAIVSPSNTAKGPQAGINPTVWGEMRFRNVVIELYPDGDLVQKMPDFRAEEATELLTKIFAAIPK